MNSLYLEPSAGFFDLVEYRDKEIRVSGWMLVPDRPFDLIKVYWNKKSVSSATPAIREDVFLVHQWIPHARNSGFSGRIPISDSGRGRLDVIGYHLGCPVARMSLRLFGSAEMSRPLPPDDLTLRVSGRQGESFRLRALKQFTDITDQIDSCRLCQGGQRILDWGCGCGGLSDLLIRYVSAAVIQGCDIDSQAIDWCQRSLPNGKFLHIAPEPPLPYAEASFDIVIGCSVFTHLARANQMAWLEEISRILAPGGLLLTSTLGPYALRRDFGQLSQGIDKKLCHKRYIKTRLSLMLRGISDSQQDHILDGIAPPNYYRTVYQTPEYTRKKWTGYFDVVRYVERGMAQYQDLVVLKKS